MITGLQRFIINRYSGRILSKWIVLAHDMILVVVAFALAQLLRLNFQIGNVNPDHFITQGIISCVVYLMAFFLFSSFSGIIRHTGVEDVKRIIQAGVFAMVVTIALSLLIREVSIPGVYIASISVSIIHFLLAFVFLTGSRFLIKLFYHSAVKRNSTFQRVVIYGAGYSGLMAKNSLESDTSLNYKVTAFLDDDPQKAGKFLHGIPVLQPEMALSEYFKKQGISELIIAIPNLAPSRKSQLIEYCLSASIRVKSVPPIASWINGSLSASQIRQVSIEDLLNRAPIHIEKPAAASEIYGKVVMITGAAGSIGSEIVRQVLKLNPAKVILIDQAESPLHDLELEIGQLKRFAQTDVQLVICDITNLPKLHRLFEYYRPNIVYHAAAYKHVPMMERNPGEAVHVNVFGTKHLVDLSIVYEVEKFVFISTDKAVNPTNIMGATKRAAEIYVQNQAHYNQCNTAFITTRFGNVLGSNGSVIPLFMKQIEQGGPVTVTSKDVTRFFMTIPEACQLVLEAGAMGKGGEIFLFDMGERVRIYDLAVKMIRLAGRVPERDIAIEEIGLRPGEKLHEELLNAAENHLPTHHPKILVGRTREFESDWVHRCIEKLRIAYADNNTIKLVLALKEMVPEFKSKNSDFQRLDQEPAPNVAATA